MIAWLKSLFLQSPPSRLARRERRWESDVVGETVKNEDGSSRREIIGRCRVGEEVVLTPIADAKRNDKKVSVRRVNGEQIGYLDGYWAFSVTKHFAMGTTVAAKITDIYNGHVRLHLSVPDGTPFR